MGHDKSLAHQLLGELWNNDKIPILDINDSNYIVFSDVHLGDGKGSDDFRENVDAFIEALNYYSEKGYKLILIGDIEEMWQFTTDEIENKYNDSVYAAIRRYGDERVLRVYGNHDMDWNVLIDPVKNIWNQTPPAVEAVKIIDKERKIKIMLLHGHQGSDYSYKHAWSSRFFVRLFRVVEPWCKRFGITTHPPAIRSQIIKEFEKIMYEWARDNDVILICGHSHNAIFAARSYIEWLEEENEELLKKIDESSCSSDEKAKIKANIREKKKKIKREKQYNRDITSVEENGKPKHYYYNTGCALYVDGLTGIEINNDRISLVKWERDLTKQPRPKIYRSGSLI